MFSPDRSIFDQNVDFCSTFWLIFWVIVNLPRFHPFDMATLEAAFPRHRFVRNRIQRLIDQGVILQLKKGLYVLAPAHGGEVAPQSAAPLLFGPSYLSLQYALSYHGLIPEGVTRLTSVTLKRNRQYETPLGVFSYQHTSKSSFWCGYGRVCPSPGGDGAYYMATAEKALCDLTALCGGVPSLKGVAAFVFDDLRIDEDDFRQLDVQCLKAYGACFRSPSVKALVRLATR